MPEDKPNEAFTYKLAVLDKLHEIAGIPPFSECRAPTKGTDNEFAAFQLQRRSGLIVLFSWDESHHNGDSYNRKSRGLTDAEAAAVLDELIADARKLAVERRAEWLRGEEERRLLAEATAEVEAEVADDTMSKAEAAYKKIEHDKMVTQVKGGQTIEELLDRSIDVDVGFDEAGSDHYSYTVDMFGQRMSGSGWTVDSAMKRLAEDVAAHLRFVADEIVSALEEEK